MRFKRVYIEISNICNLNCEFCSPLKREKRSMTEDEFKSVVSQIKPYTSFVYFHVKGEPLMHPLLERFLDIAHENGLRVNLTTNGTMLKQRQELLLSHPAVRQLNISLHAFEKDEYLKDALTFAKLADLKGIYVVLRLWNLDENDNAPSLGLNMMQEIETAFSLEKSLRESMGGRKSVKIAPHVFVGWEREFEWPSLEHEFVSDSGFCYGMRYQIAILADGTVVPCCLDANGEAPLGNIHRQSFKSIIESKTAKEIRHGFENLTAVAPLCKRCSFRTKFDV